MNSFIRMMLGKADGMFQSWMSRRTYEFPGTVEEFPDISYLPDGKAYHKMDIYRPKDVGGKLPVIVNFHGGGMVLCKKDVNRPVCAELARRGFLVFCVDYPLVPEKQVPEILEDVCRSMDAVDSMLDARGGDRERVCLVGDSAGAFLAVYAAAAQKSEAIAAAAGVRPSRLPVRALGLLHGMFHTAECDETGFFLRKDFYGKNWRKHPLLPYLKPECRAVASLMPPVFLLTSGGDKLRRSTLRFYKGLKNADIPCECMDVPGFSHDFVIIQLEKPESQRALNAMTEFLVDKSTKLY